jgi:hypothetical protein
MSSSSNTPGYGEILTRCQEKLADYVRKQVAELRRAGAPFDVDDRFAVEMAAEMMSHDVRHIITQTILEGYAEGLKEGRDQILGGRRSSNPPAPVRPQPTLPQWVVDTKPGKKP